MACYKPLKGYVALGGGFTFKRKESYGKLMEVSCGRCIGCRIMKTREWAVRSVHEASQHKENCFITLTYSDKNLPPHGTLNKKHFQKFMKRLRRIVEPKVIRFYHSGEYGEKTGRPHYHALIFGHDFEDRKLLSVRNNVPLYTSKVLTKLWGLGHASVGTVTLQSAGYVARYTMKKVVGQYVNEINKITGLKPYERLCEYTGNIVEIIPEYATMSLKPGIGAEWFKKYKTDVFPEDFVVMDGKKVKTPHYYFTLLEREDAQGALEIKEKRIKGAVKHAADNTPARLAVRETCQRAKLKLLPRNLE